MCACSAVGERTSAVLAKTVQRINNGGDGHSFGSIHELYKKY